MTNSRVISLEAALPVKLLVFVRFSQNEDKFGRVYAKKTCEEYFLTSFIQLETWTQRGKFSRRFWPSLRLNQTEMSTWYTHSILRSDYIYKNSPLLVTISYPTWAYGIIVK